MVRQEWVVVMEAVCTPAVFDFTSLQRLLLAAHDCSPVGLHAPDRCGLQLRVTADDTSDALTVAMQRWGSAVSGLRHLEWKVTRVEVMTVEEFEYDCDVVCRHSDIWPSETTEWEAGQLGNGAELLRLAFEDQVTGMETPGIFAYRLEEAAARRRDAHSSALLMIDFEELKAGNNQSGAELGDVLLAEVADRLLGVLGGAGKTARMGKNRVAVLLDPASEETAVSTADRILEALRRPFHLEGGDVTLRASVGLAMDLDGDGSALMENATVALVTAKVSDPGGVHVFRPGSPFGQAASDLAPGTGSQLERALLLLRRTALTAAESAGLAEAVTAVLPEICAYAGWPLAHLCLVDPSGGFSATPVWYSSDPARFQAIQRTITVSQAPLAGALCRRVLAMRRPEWTSALDDVGVPASQATAAGLHAVVVVPLLAGNEVVAALQGFVVDSAEPDAAVLDTLGLAGFHLGQAAHRKTTHASPVSSRRPTASRPREGHRAVPVSPPAAPLRYELFGWEPARPAPSLDAYVRRGTGAASAKDLCQALNVTYERLAAAVVGRSLSTADDPHGSD